MVDVSKIDGRVQETFGKYRLTERLAFGGMAEVFLARVHGEAGFSKPVVIKRLHPRFNQDREFVKMLIDEARITARLTHSNICQVLDLGSVDGSYYMAMEYIAGEDLRAVHEYFIKRDLYLPVGAALYITAEMLEGLNYAHDCEDDDGHSLHLIHRDVSPQNVLISYEGEVKLIDFGIAKARQRMVQTQVGVIKGKFRYMSPEQASGAEIDSRTDIFAAGIVLYELLRGGPHLTDVPDTEVLRRMRDGDIEPLSQVRPELPRALTQLVHKALTVKLRKRYQTAAEFRQAIIGYMRDNQISYGRGELGELMRGAFEQRRRQKQRDVSARAVSAPSGSEIAAARSASGRRRRSASGQPAREARGAAARDAAALPQEKPGGKREPTAVLESNDLIVPTPPGAGAAPPRVPETGRKHGDGLAYARTSASEPHAVQEPRLPPTELSSEGTARAPFDKWREAAGGVGTGEERMDTYRSAPPGQQVIAPPRSRSPQPADRRRGGGRRSEGAAGAGDRALVGSLPTELLPEEQLSAAALEARGADGPDDAGETEASGPPSEVRRRRRERRSAVRGEIGAFIGRVFNTVLVLALVGGGVYAAHRMGLFKGGGPAAIRCPRHGRGARVGRCIEARRRCRRADGGLASGRGEDRRLRRRNR